nr:helix-turn-helix domain-containing protein [Parahaliea mediterranea]
MLRDAREARGLSPLEAADRLNWMPSYVGIIERDDYAALRCPAFARGYLKAYAKLVGLDEAPLLAAFDAAGDARSPELPAAPRRRPAPSAAVPRLAIGLCLCALVLVALGLWWWRSEALVPAPLIPAAQSPTDNANTGEV